MDSRLSPQARLAIAVPARLPNGPENEAPYEHQNHQTYYPAMQLLRYRPRTRNRWQRLAGTPLHDQTQGQTFNRPCLPTLLKTNSRFEAERKLNGSGSV